MKKKSRFVVYSLLLVIVALVILAVGPFRNWSEVPLGPTLPVFETASANEAKTSPYTLGRAESSATPVGGATALQPASTSGQPVCGGPPRMILLAVGADTTTGYYRGLADVIRIVRVDFVNPSISVLAFPRDLWISFNGLEDRDITQTRINAVYFYGNLYRLPGGGPTLLARALYDNFGLATDHYLAVNMAVFVKAVDAVGGIDIYALESVDGTSQGLPYFRSGWHHMTGEIALKYSRVRFPDSDWDRIDRQTDVLKALRDKILQPGIFPHIPSLVNSFLDDTLTDLSPEEIYSLICLVPKIPEGNISAHVIERSMVTPTITEKGAYIMIPHMEQIRNFVRSFIDGALP